MSDHAAEAALIKTKQHIEETQGKIIASISGGADSDVMLDLIERARGGRSVEYNWFNTGLEYDATKRHLNYLRQRYGIEIHEHRATKPVPISCKEYGQPFLSKQVSMYIGRLQRHGFDWSNEPYDTLVEKFPKCQSALKWWCNAWGDKSRFNIERNFSLKEFMTANPPWFKISDKCCEYAKKAIAHEIEKQSGAELSMVGLRQSEGGVRAVRIKSCFTPRGKQIAQFRPLFWMTDDDRSQYEAEHHIVHSDCYSVYGLSRTGCACCPFGSRFENELEVAQKYEPKLYQAVNNIFGDSYQYTRMYREFKKNRRNKEEPCREEP